MKMAITRGMCFDGKNMINSDIVVRQERTGDFSTVSFAFEIGKGIMIQIVVNDEVKKIFKGCL